MPCVGHSQEFDDYIQRLRMFYFTGPKKRVLALFAYSRGHWFDSRIEYILISFATHIVRMSAMYKKYGK